MGVRELIDKFKSEPTTSVEQFKQQKDEWTAALDRLFQEIEGWLEPAIQGGYLTTRRVQAQIIEQDFGTYDVPMLEILRGGLTVRLEPIGVRVVGVVAAGKRLVGLRGRVDLVCGPIRIPIVRSSPATWKALPLRGEPRELDEETFSEILEEVLLDE